MAPVDLTVDIHRSRAQTRPVGDLTTPGLTASGATVARGGARRTHAAWAADAAPGVNRPAPATAARPAPRDARETPLAVGTDCLGIYSWIGAAVWRRRPAPYELFPSLMVKSRAKNGVSNHASFETPTCGRLLRMRRAGDRFARSGHFRPGRSVARMKRSEMRDLPAPKTKTRILLRSSGLRATRALVASESGRGERQLAPTCSAPRRRE